MMLGRSWSWSTTAESTGSIIFSSRARDELGRAETTQVDSDVAISRHGLLQGKGDVEVGWRVERNITEAHGGSNFQLL
jgi:hypothetical protein